MSTLLSKEDSKPTIIQFRNIQIKCLSIPKNSQTFYSELLFTAEVPARVIVFFVKSSSKAGSQFENPFNFQRKWSVPAGQDEQMSLTPGNNQDFLAEKIRQLEETNRALLESIQGIQKSLNKGKGKRNANAPSSCGSLTNNFQSVSLNDLANVGQPESDFYELRSQTSSQRTSTTHQESVNVGGTKEVYLKKVDLTINGASIDQVEDKQTEGISLALILIQAVLIN